MSRNIVLIRLFFISMIAFSVVCIHPQPSYASPPEDVQLKYNLNTQTLSVTITHDTMLKGSHFVKFVEIKKNHSVVSVNTYSSQPTGKTFTYYYKLPAIEEDTFQVVASCNLYGAKTSPLLTVTP